MRIEELDATDTPIGVISLRRRFDRVVGRDVYEVKIDDEFLMSSLFTVVEQELGVLSLARSTNRPSTCSSEGSASATR